MKKLSKKRRKTLLKKVINFMHDKYVIGIDEAGRGCLVGGLWVAAIATKSPEYLKAIEVNDSKKLSKKKREELYEAIKDNCLIETIRISVKDIDTKNLNDLEMDAVIKIIKRFAEKLQIERVNIDALSVNWFKDKYHIFNKVNEEHEDFQAEVVTKPKADAIFPSVSAASIVAKVLRDKEMEESEVPGSGYPADRVTYGFIKKYYKENKCFPDCVRQKWKTIKKIKNNGV